MFTLAAALALAALEPDGPSQDPPLTDLCALPGEDAAAARADWAIIDAREITSPKVFADALKNAPAGKRRVVHGGHFKGADMRPLAPLLAGACLVETELEGTTWEGSDIPNLRLVHIAFIGAKAARVRWPGLSTHGVDPEGSDFTAADLAGMRFVSAWQGAAFRDVSFRGANLTEASFACGITIDVWCINPFQDFSGADLTRADLSSIGVLEDEVKGARIDGTIIPPHSLGALAAARIEGPVRLGNDVASPYDYLVEEPSPPVPTPAPTAYPTIVTLTPEEARSLIAATRALAEVDDRASFDCAKAATLTERIICVSDETDLRSLDRELAAMWAQVVAVGKGDLAQQRRWLASRAKCGQDRDCISLLYQARIERLRALLGPRIALKPGESVTYHDDTLPLPDAMRTGELYARILPVLREASYQRVTLTGNPDGSIAAEGDAIGANAHMCDLSVTAARFDPKTGWWSARAEGGKRVPLFRVEGRRIFFYYSGNIGNTPDEAMEFISCGARAGFGEGIDLSPG
ncbi:hypothetical protein [Erythrobacter donghaensis]|jgi:uncharacterized protein YjbI with pentapeptide repeats|uniref:hypothetical protein n=1 Tax=Erythrobacter donghaensis TaxID=267135 RepID=UPI000939926E|nr:hypothetical protein [Erythrobacter donghaensis]